MTINRKGTFKPASARSKKAALAAFEEEPGQLDQPLSIACEKGWHGDDCPMADIWSCPRQEHLCECSCHPACGEERGCKHD